MRRLCSVSQLSSSVLMEIGASCGSRCVMDRMTVKTNLMKETVRVCLRVAISAVITTHAVYLRPSCVMVRETALMDLMRKSVVCDIRWKV